MSLGALTIVEQAAGVGPIFFIRATIVGDGAYSAGGTTGLLAKLKTALKDDSVNILSCRGEGDNGGYTVVYDHANEKLKVYQGDNANVASGPQVEDTTANQSGRTYGLFIIAS